MGQIFTSVSMSTRKEERFPWDFIWMVLPQQPSSVEWISQIKYSKLRLFQVFQNLASWSLLQHTNYFLNLLKTKTTIAQFATVLIIKEAKWENILIKSNLLKDVFPKLLVNEWNCQGNRTTAFYVARTVSRTRCLVNNLRM